MPQCNILTSGSRVNKFVNMHHITEYYEIQFALLCPLLEVSKKQGTILQVNATINSQRITWKFNK